MAQFHESAPQPAALPRRKKRRAQRVPEPPPTETSSPVRPPASPPASLESITPGQRPPSAAGSVADESDDVAFAEEDSCSILASGSEDWSSSVDLAPPARGSSGKRANIESELTRLLSQAVESLGLEWSAPVEPAHNRMAVSLKGTVLQHRLDLRLFFLSFMKNSRNPGLHPFQPE